MDNIRSAYRVRRDAYRNMDENDRSNVLTGVLFVSFGVFVIIAIMAIYIYRSFDETGGWDIEYIGTGAGISAIWVVAMTLTVMALSSSTNSMSMER